MSTPTFIWSPRIDPTGTTTLRKLAAQFGDGYKQEAADGINNKMQSWPLSFAGSASMVSAIMAFLDGQQGYMAFYWTPPLGATGLYKCAAYTQQPLGNGTYQLSCTFEQAFQP